MIVTDDVRYRAIPLPLKHTEVHAVVSGCIGTVDVKQEFTNPYDRKIEAVYVFPLPHDAAINEFIMTIGERRIRGIIRERTEAEKIYREARNQGYAASLLTEERPNVFRESVANIEPGKEIDVNIKYFQTLAYDNGWYEFVFPMVVGPCYNPAGATNGIGAVERGNAGASGQGMEVEYLRPEERSGHDIALRLDVEAGVKIEESECATHRIVKERSGEEHLSVTLAAEDRIPNKDFVLRYRLAGERIKSELMTHHNDRGRVFCVNAVSAEGVDGTGACAGGDGFCAGLFGEHVGRADNAGEGGDRAGAGPAIAGGHVSDHHVFRSRGTVG